MMFQGEMIDKISAPNHFVTFGFEDVGNVFPGDDVMYVLDGVPITLSSVIVLREPDISDGVPLWSDECIEYFAHKQAFI
jgi:hypothetical protein